MISLENLYSLCINSRKQRVNYEEILGSVTRVNGFPPDGPEFNSPYQVILVFPHNFMVYEIFFFFPPFFPISFKINIWI